MKVKMTAVESSNIAAIGYADENKELYVNFKTSSYVYYDVPRKIYDDMLKADSKGQFLWKNIRDKYDYSCLKKQ